MNDLISREAAWEEIKKVPLINPDRMAFKLQQALWDVPAVDAAHVVHGEWKGFTRSRFYGIDKYSDPIYRDGIIWHCSKCSRRSVIKTNYCPNCGAKMDGRTK